MGNIFKKQAINSVETLTTTKAKQIYLDMRANYFDETEAFVAKGHNVRHCRRVVDEVSDIRDQAVDLMVANPDITAADVKSGVTCTLLDVDEVGVDIIKLFPFRDDDRTFQQFKDAYVEE